MEIVYILLKIDRAVMRMEVGKQLEVATSVFEKLLCFHTQKNYVDTCGWVCFA